MRIGLAVLAFASGVFFGFAAYGAGDVTVQVLAEEEVYLFVNPNNGSGPLWSYGCTPLARIGDAVYLSQMETGPDVPLLCNTRWKLLRRGTDGWRTVCEAEGYRQREPAVLAIGAPGQLFLNVNDSKEEAGVKYGTCAPHLIRFVFQGDTAERSEVMPVWKGKPTFTDHSYRGYAADPARGQLLMLNIDAKTSVQNACLLSAPGETVASGTVSFPIRGCYPQAALIGGAIHLMVVGDIVEPVEAWRQYKFEQTQQNWDYVFRILYYTTTPDLSREDFLVPLEVANVDATGGHISNKDMWISPMGEAYLMYTEREVASPLLRDKFFPGKSVIDSLKLAVVSQGIVVKRLTLLEGTEQRYPGDARFHVSADGTVYAVVFVAGEDSGNKLLQVYPPKADASLISIPMQRPFTSFLLASVRAGNSPSDVIDMMGFAGSSDKISYAQVRIGRNPR